MSDRWDDLRFNVAEGEWAARPLGDMRRCLADLLAERDRYAKTVQAAVALLDGGPPCDLHRGKPDTDPDLVTYCFTCHENYPCWGEDVRAAAGLLRALTEEDDRG